MGRQFQPEMLFDIVTIAAGIAKLRTGNTGCPDM